MLHLIPNNIKTFYSCLTWRKFVAIQSHEVQIFPRIKTGSSKWNWKSIQLWEMYIVIYCYFWYFVSLAIALQLNQNNKRANERASFKK